MTAFLMGIVLVIGALFFGRSMGKKETKTKISGEITIQKQRAEKAEAERDIAVATAQNLSQKTANDVAIEQYFDEFEREVQTAKKEDNILMSIEAARKLAERAEAWRQRNSK